MSRLLSDPRQGCEGAAPGAGGDAGAAGGAGLVAGLESAGAGDLAPPSFGFGEAGNVGMVCLRLGASGRTSGPFCPQAASVPVRYTIKHAATKHFMVLSIPAGPLGIGRNFYLHPWVNDSTTLYRRCG
jgi:hypothetical protein